MNVTELMQIVSDEDLDCPVLYGGGKRRADAVVLDRDDAGWRVCIIDERHQAIHSTIRIFDDESDALDHVLRKLRETAEARRAMVALRVNHPAPAPE